MATCCPIESQSVAQVEPIPNHGSNHGEDACETVGPIRTPRLETQQQIHQQSRPELSADGLLTLQTMNICEIFKSSSSSKTFQGLASSRLSRYQKSIRIFDTKVSRGAPKDSLASADVIFCRPAKETTCLPHLSRQEKLSPSWRRSLQDCAESFPHKRHIAEFR